MFEIPSASGGGSPRSARRARIACTTLASGREWTPIATHRDAARVRIEPFDPIELDLSLLWAK